MLILVAQVADVDQSVGQERDEARVTALHVAVARHAPLTLVEALVEKTHPTILNAHDAAGQSPLHLAVRCLATHV